MSIIERPSSSHDRRSALAAFLLASTTMMVVACGTAVNNPVAPAGADVGAPGEFASGSAGEIRTGAGSTGSSSGKVDICHRTEGTNDFIPITVALPALDAHLAHGDARVGDPVPGQPDMAFGPDCTPVPRGPVVITFDGLSGSPNLSPFSPYSESGFTVSPASGSWLILTTYGNPAPSIIFQRSAAEPTITAAAQVTSGGSAFRFTSVDLYSSITEIPYTFTGLMGSTPVFEVSGTVPNTFGNFVTVSNPHSTDLIDTLVITLSNPATPCCSNPVGFDNVAVVR